MTTTEQDPEGTNAVPPFVGTTTARVEVGRYILDLDSPGGMTVSLAPRPRQSDPPAELVTALNEPEEPRGRRGVIERASDAIDTASAVTDKVERAVELGRGLIEGRGPGAQLIAEELGDLLGLLGRLDRSGRCEEVIRLGRPLCRLLALTLRWAVLVESLRIVLHAATALADERATASALHDLGTLHQGVDDVDRARQLLGQARDIRRRIGDEQGLQATEHNLELLAQRRGALPSMATLIVIGAVVAVVLVLALVTTVGGGPSPTPGPPSARTAKVMPPALRFGPHEVGRTARSESVTWFNRGSVALAVASVKLGGADPEDFFIATNGCRGKTVAPRHSCTVSITFTPTAVGARSGSLRFAGAAQPSTQQVTLSGTGTSKAPPGPGTTALAVKPRVIDFGPYAQDQTSGAQTVTLINDSTTALTPAPARPAGADAHDFTVSANHCSGTSVPPRGTCTVIITFTPAALGSRTASLNLADRANPSVHRDIPLSGTGIAAAQASVSPHLVAWTSDQVGDTRTVTLTNHGNAALAVASVTPGGADANDFPIVSDTCSKTSVPPGRSCQVIVRFMPTAAGALAATLDFSDPGTQSANLTGIGPGTSSNTGSTGSTGSTGTTGTTGTTGSGPRTNYGPY